MHRAVFVFVVFALIGCGGQNKAATASSAATATNTAAQEINDKQQVTRATDNLESASLNLSQTTLNWGKARLVSASFAANFTTLIIHDLDVTRTANDELVKWEGKAPPLFASIDTENKRDTDRTDAFLRQYRQAFYADDSSTVLSLLTDHLNDMKRHRAVLTDEGFIVPAQ